MTTPENSQNAAKPGTPPRTRSPNYPAINLEAAIVKATTLYTGSMRRHPVGVETLASQWRYKPKSSSFKLALAAVRAFGLLEEVPNGAHKLHKLTSLALDIVADYPEGSPEHRRAIKTAALRPKLHQELWKRWGAELPPDEEIKRYLVRERGFNDRTVSEFIAEYKETLSFAKLDANDKIDLQDAPSDDEDDAPADVNVGDYVQWTSGGVDQFPQPRRVVGLSDDGEWAFVEGTATGVPVIQLTVARPPTMNTVPSAPPPAPPSNPYYQQASLAKDLPQKEPVPTGYKEDAYDLAEGRAVVRWPEKLEAESVEELKDWFDLIIRKMERITGAKRSKRGAGTDEPD